VQSLESGQKALEVEWENMYDSLRRMMGKISRRAARDVETAESTFSPPTGAPGVGEAGLPHIDPMSARIRASRRSSAQ
jgi:hypothetical protein